MAEIFKNLRGIRRLTIAVQTNDTQEEIQYDVPVRFAGAKEIGNEPEESSSTDFYDNKSAIIINAEGADVYSIVCSVISDEVRAVIEGRKFDKTTGEFMAVPTKKPYIAIGFIGTDTSDVDYAYWILKGRLTGGGEKYVTKDDGTDSTNLEYEYTSIYTEQEFEKANNQPLKYYKVPLSKLNNENEWFENVTTPENVKLKSETPAPTLLKSK